MANGWAELPEELLVMALERLGWGGRESAAVRLTSSRWRRIHDEGRKTFELRWRGTDEAVVALCGRMPALTKLDLEGASSVTDVALQAVAELKGLTWLDETAGARWCRTRACRQWLSSSASPGSTSPFAR